ncbi:threonine synthase [Ligilactobacillus salitolerans]|uniref:Threonine synthase n=1 Tax=Ligilactobacillus salitolerans TaxID=1808352 RepID=A0A401IQQ9_9LACO|nr:threonine synthase [Ligilactobacillus salitolerans]GBG93853.1 threonine synthase [Ligilactobacillus salitolerans]
MGKKFTSTRSEQFYVSAKEALKKGLASDRGLFVDPELGEEQLDLAEILNLDYQELAQKILACLLPDFSPAEIKASVLNAYDDKFDSKQITPLRQVGGFYALELWHGPTSAFKDLGLQILPYLLKYAISPGERSLVLTATSGDTGKAALEGFKDTENVGIVVFYPDGGVSSIQEKQMLTTNGTNTKVAAITGNFDDAQQHVKEIFNDVQLQEKLGERVHLSSANSINIGRLAPQVVYYFAAYQQLVAQGTIELGDQVNFTVPTGNFGDVLAGYYAKLLGLPVKKLIVASNANNVLVDFFSNGVYDRNRPFLQTAAPSMDIQVSSNLERLLYYESGLDSGYVKKLMDQLEATGRYQITAKLLENLQADFACGYSTDAQIKAAIREVYEQEGYLMDPHTAAGYHVMHAYQKRDSTPMVLLSTANPYKFAETTAQALWPQANLPADTVSLMQKIAEYTHMSIPQNLLELDHLPQRSKKVLVPAEMQEYVKEQTEAIFDDQSQSTSNQR